MEEAREMRVGNNHEPNTTNRRQSTAPSTATSISQAVGSQLGLKIKDSRVLLVGAGGIGCELLKNLVCSGFGTSTQSKTTQNGEGHSEDNPAESTRTAEIVVVDLDTIDLSNLNRQFLFRKQHIKKPKALVAKDTALQFNPAARIEAHHSSIFDDQYNVEFFSNFDLVFNALDNLAARRHVNKMCLAAGVPLIESGTTGFNGQVQAILKGVTECYDCNPKPVQTSYPICTIRSTPSQPIHCIVWAKSYLFPELFGASEDSDIVVQAESDDTEEVAKLKEEAEALKNIRATMGSEDFTQNVFNKVFHDDIERLRSMTEMWKSRRMPESLQFENLTELAAIIKQGQAIALQDQNTWTMLENISVFCSSLDALSKRAGNGENIIEFDKDDKHTLDFVAAAANLRSYIFGIPLHSEWEIKQMAGNIIPAIATSNAITASLCVLEAFQMLRHQFSQEARQTNGTTNEITSQLRLGGAQDVFLAPRHTERTITSQALSPPNPACPVCSPIYAQLQLPSEGNTELSALVDLLKQQIGYEEFSIAVDNLGIIYDPDLDENLSKPLSEFGIDGKRNIFFTVSDDSDQPKVDLVLSVKTTAGNSGGENGVVSLLPSNIVLPNKPVRPSTAQDNDGNKKDTPLPTASATAGEKRKRGPEDEGDTVQDSSHKRIRADDGPTIIEDDGMILLDE